MAIGCDGWKSRRTAAFYSATLVLIGLYLLFVAAVGYYIAYFGGTWGRAAQASLFMGALTLLAALWLSGAVRSKLQVFIAKHFFRYRYDYREEWLKFTALLSARRSPSETVRADRARPRGNGGVPVRQSVGAELRRTALRAGHPLELSTQSTSTRGQRLALLSLPAAQADGSSTWTSCEARRERYADLTLPSWLLATAERLAGRAAAGRTMNCSDSSCWAGRASSSKLDWEVLDLLKTAGRQAAGYLAHEAGHRGAARGAQVRRLQPHVGLRGARPEEPRSPSCS
ncbi:MAG: hypothetical protein MZW92_27090 [Comamonadaceae bacterium]|nr:hypothetical protein [Comamonadaceae bacterium]